MVLRNTAVCAVRDPRGRSLRRHETWEPVGLGLLFPRGSLRAPQSDRPLGGPHARVPLGDAVQHPPDDERAQGDEVQ